MSEPLVESLHLTKYFDLGKSNGVRQVVHAVDDVTLTIQQPNKSTT